MLVFLMCDELLILLEDVCVFIFLISGIYKVGTPNSFNYVKFESYVLRFFLGLETFNNNYNVKDVSITLNIIFQCMVELCTVLRVFFVNAREFNLKYNAVICCVFDHEKYTYMTVSNFSTSLHKIIHTKFILNG